MTAPAAYVLMLGVLVQLATGWPLWVGVVLGTALSVGYVFRGGLRAVVATDKVQFVLMFAAFLVLVPVCVVKFGGWSFLRADLPAGHLDVGRRPGLAGGGRVVRHRGGHAGRTGVLPALLRRGRPSARRGAASCVSIGFWIVFDFLTTTAGLYARAVLPDLADPVAAFPALAAVALPGFWQGLFMVGLLATIMSTVDSYAFIAAVTAGPRPDAPAQVPARALLGEEDVANLRSVRWACWRRRCWPWRWRCGRAVGGRAVEDAGHGGHAGAAAAGPAAQFGRAVAGPRVVWSMGLSGGVALLWLALGRGGPWLGVEAIFSGVLVSLGSLLFRK